jgi:vitamin B12 transporter
MAASLHAQTIELDPVVVSATRIEQKLSDVIPSASVITREEIERSQAATLVDLIQGQHNGHPGIRTRNLHGLRLGRNSQAHAGEGQEPDGDNRQKDHE